MRLCSPHQERFSNSSTAVDCNELRARACFRVPEDADFLVSCDEGLFDWHKVDPIAIMIASAILVKDEDSAV